ncbi:MAG TPA: 1-phosphofructokinase family hexose kinase [Prolixibacteraceae bacterium]|nr:1-phosphofructokinase family hexose kinase [Prolixibacteraceae bacterium]
MNKNKMKIVTLTMNPVLDKTSETKIVVPEKKTRCKSPRYEPGGGGINVSRAIKKLGGESMAIIVVGGDNGNMVENLLKAENINVKTIDSGENTRENIMVQETKTGSQYRFVMPGPEMKEKVWKKVLEEIKSIKQKPNYLVASGSLPPGVPDDFYAEIARYAKKNDIRFVLDSSGEPLKLAIKEGVHMIKPNLGEMANIIGKEQINGMELEEAAKEILKKGQCSVLVVSLGAKGAMLATNDEIDYIVPPTMPVVSAVGAGDSMVGGMLVGCTNGLWYQQAAYYGVAAGTAAAMTPGSELCRKEDTDKIFDWISANNALH